MKHLFIFALSFLLMGACSQPEQTPDPVEYSNTLEIENGWVRPGNAGMMTAAYFTINNGTQQADTLVSIQSNVTNDTQIHESFEKEDGMMGMREIGQVPIAANATAELKPGGIHIMIIRPTMDVQAGDSVDFVLNFVEFGMMELRLPVRSSSN